MRYYDFITQFEGIEHPFGDLAADIKTDVESDEDLLEIFEGDSFSDIYDHLINKKASKDSINTFVQSWAAYLEHEKKAMRDPLPALILSRLSHFDKGLEALESLKDININLECINDSLAEISQSFYDVKETRFYNGEKYHCLRICGVVDTFEQN